MAGLKEIRIAILKAESQLLCSDYVHSQSDVDTLVKVLTEIREYDLAIALAKETQTSLYYPVMKLFTEYSAEQDQNASSHQDLLDRQAITKDESEWLGQSVPSKKALWEEKLRDLITGLNIRDLTEIAQGVWTQNHHIPKILEEEIKRARQHQILLELYLSDNRMDFEKAIDLFLQDTPQTVRVLTEVDLQLLVFFLECCDESIKANNEQMAELVKNRNEKLKVLIMFKDTNDIVCTQEFEEDVFEYLGLSSKEQYDETYEDKLQNGRGLDGDLDIINEDIKQNETLTKRCQQVKTQIIALLKQGQFV